jgi:hypothetical protein
MKKKSQISIPASVCLDLYESILSNRKWAFISDFLDLTKVFSKKQGQIVPLAILPAPLP